VALRRGFVTFLLLVMRPVLGWGAGVIVNFDPSTPSVGPFPTDFLTVTDPSQKTALRVNLPLPDCATQPNNCAEANALNQLDGFALQPRISVQFSGAIDPTTLQSGIVLVWLDNLTSDEPGLAATGTISTVNQAIYDPITQTAYAKPNDFFDQHRHYALLVTDAVRDTVGDPVQADPNFTACTQSPSSDYCTALGNALGNLSALVAPQNVIAASTLTTMTATSWLEAARDLVASSGPVQVTRNGASVAAANIASVNLHAQVKANPAGFQDFPQTIPSATFTGVDRIVFDTFKSPNFLNSQQYIPNTPTGMPLAAVAATNDVVVHTFVPSSKMPADGYPVILFGHGFSENSLESPTIVASNFAQKGFAVMAINAVGHGYGSQTTIQIKSKDGSTVSYSSGGRGVDLDGDGQILDYEGCVVSAPAPTGLRDCLRQTVVDLMQMVHAIKGGVLLEDANGVRLDPSHIYYAGLSLGAIYGSMLHAVDPNIQIAVLCSGGGSIIDIARWTQAGFLHSIMAGFAGARTPPLLNNGKDFTDNYVLRNQPVQVNNIAGAIDLQNLFANLEWLQTGGDPLSYAPHLTLSPLPNVPAKQALFLIPEGDRTVPNPQESALIRAAGMLSSTSLYRYDLAAPLAKRFGFTLPADPHAFLVDITSAATLMIANAAQQVVATYLTSNGATIPTESVLGTQVLQTPTAYLESLNWQ
jgi:hypothetical protein